jgi:VIT1/CCC1 family predicted Fe2+/Mn2+ transporter
MAVKTKKKNVKTGAKSLPSPFNNYWNRTNYLLFGLGALLIIFGFYFMSLGEWNSTSSLVVSPILLFFGFVVVMPASILYRKKENAQTEELSKTEN